MNTESIVRKEFTRAGVGMQAESEEFLRLRTMGRTPPLTASAILAILSPMKTKTYLILSVGLALSAGHAQSSSFGEAFTLPDLPTHENAPRVYEYSQEAGPDETLFVVGENLTSNVFLWGVHPEKPGGAKIPVKVQFQTTNYLAFTVSEHASDGPMVAAVQNSAGYSAPFVINRPLAWWCSPRAAAPGAEVRIFGRNLARRPDFRKAFVQLASPSGLRDLRVVRCGKYEVVCALPPDIRPGAYGLRVHAGHGGEYGWSDTLELEVAAAPGGRARTQTLAAPDAAALQSRLDALAARGGGTLQLKPGAYPFHGSLRVPAGVTLRGAGRGLTTLELQHSKPTDFRCFRETGWGISPTAIHCIGDTLTYAVRIPTAGTWTLWLRYATDMSPWQMPGVSGKSTVQWGDAAPVPLPNLPNTGGFNVYKWATNGTFTLPAGPTQLTWRNTGGGGMCLDAFVLCLDPAETPNDRKPPADGPACVVVQGEDADTFSLRDGKMPHRDWAAVWLSGDGAGLADLTVLGNAQVNQGILVQAASGGTGWVSRCTVTNVCVADAEGKQHENYGILLRNVRDSRFTGNEIWGRAPVWLSGVRRCAIQDNRLVSVTRFGGGAEGAILGRCEPVEECVIENNAIASPPGTGAGGGTCRRMIWLSTGHGSVVRNWIAGNHAEAEGQAGQPRFGGVAGTDQNVGETILFEGNHRTMFFGPLTGADARSVTLPEALPPTPDGRLGNVKRDTLATNDAGDETPFWPPLADDGTGEPPQAEYFVTLFAGPGQGQTRRVTGRDGPRLLLDRPWRVPPAAGTIAAVGTMFHQNHIIGNTTPDGMTGIQLWISCVENVIAENTILRQRKPGLYLYANGTTLATSMPRTWNRGISPLFWNTVEGNRTDECSDGALVTSGDAPNLPIEFPRALGNVLRHNSFIKSRASGLAISGRATASPDGAVTTAIAGTIAEYNTVRDASVAYNVSAGADYTVLRRDHAYHWYPVSLSAEPPVAFQIHNPSATCVLEKNEVEGKFGVNDPKAIIERK